MKEAFLTAQITFLRQLLETDLNSNVISWINDDLDYIDVLYYNKPADSDFQISLSNDLKNGDCFGIGVDEAIWLLSVRINNTIDS